MSEERRGWPSMEVAEEARRAVYRGELSVVQLHALDTFELTAQGVLKPGVSRWGVWQWPEVGTGEVVYAIRYAVDTRDMSEPKLWVCQDREGRRPSRYWIDLHAEGLQDGIRWHMSCPVVKDGHQCTNLVYRLYMPPENTFFGCEECHDLNLMGDPSAGYVEAVTIGFKRDS